jgi:hypothetical protein
MQFSTLSLFINVAFGDGCNAENPKTSAMTDSFKSHYDDVASAGTIDQLTGGTAAFREYVQQCASGEGTAQASNQYEHEDDYFPLNFAEEIGGTTMFYNRKSGHQHLDIYGGDLLVIPSNYFEVVNEAKKELSDDDFKILVKALVESGLYKAIRDGDNGKNNWPSVNSVLSDSQGGDREEFDYIYFCLHLEGNTTIDWMHMHVFQSHEWRSNDNLWNGANTCAKLQRPAASDDIPDGWHSLIYTSTGGFDLFTAAVEQVASCLISNYGDGHTSLVPNFDTCGQDNSSSVSATRSPSSSSADSTTTQAPESTTTQAPESTTQAPASTSESADSITHPADSITHPADSITHPADSITHPALVLV